MDEELINQIEEEDGININDLLDECNLEIDDELVLGSEENIVSFIYKLIDTIGLRKTIYVTESINMLEEKLKDLINGDPSLESAYERIEDEDDTEKFETKDSNGNSYEDPEEILKICGIDYTTHKLIDMESFEYFIFDRITIDEETIKNYIDGEDSSIYDIKSGLEEMISNFSEEEKSEILSEAGRLIIREMMRKEPDSINSILKQLIKEFRVKTIDIPPYYNLSIPKELFDCPSIEAINVDKENMKYSSIDGVLFNKNESELIIYPAAKEGEEYSISDKITEINKYAFLGATKLKAINVDESNGRYFSEDGILFAREYTGSSLLCYPGGKEDTEYTISDLVCNIHPQAFYNVVNLKRVSISETATPEMIKYIKIIKGITDITVRPLSIDDAISQGYINDGLSREKQEEQYRKHVTAVRLANSFIRK